MRSSNIRFSIITQRTENSKCELKTEMRISNLLSWKTDCLWKLCSQVKRFRRTLRLNRNTHTQNKVNRTAIGNIIMMPPFEYDTSSELDTCNSVLTSQSRERCDDHTLVPTTVEPFGQHIITALAKVTLKHIWTWKTRIISDRVELLCHYEFEFSKRRNEQ